MRKDSWVSLAVALCVEAWLANLSLAMPMKSPANRTLPDKIRLTPTVRYSARELGGHSFLKSTLVPMPFTTPYITSSLEGAFATIHVEGAESDLKAAGLTPSFAGQFQISDLAIELGISVSEIVGVDDYSALVLGANFSYNISGSIRLPVFQNQRWVVTPSLTYASIKGGSFSPINAVASTIMTKAEASNFLTSISTTLLQPGLLGAVTLSPTFGLTGEISYILAKATSGAEITDEDSIRAGLALSMNLQPTLGIPVGLVTAFRNDWPTKPEAESTPIYEIGVFEMFRSNFNFGVEMTKLVTTTPTMSVLLSMTYYY